MAWEREKVRSRVERLKQSNKMINLKSWHLNVHSGRLWRRRRKKQAKDTYFDLVQRYGNKMIEINLNVMYKTRIVCIGSLDRITTMN